MHQSKQNYLYENVLCSKNEPLNLNSKHNLVMETYFHYHSVEKHKKDKIGTFSFPKFVSF